MMAAVPLAAVQLCANASRSNLVLLLLALHSCDAGIRWTHTHWSWSTRLITPRFPDGSDEF